MNKKEYAQTNQNWLTAKAKEEGVKSLPKGIYYTLKVGSLPCSKCVWAINGRSISLPKWVMASSHSQASPEVPHSSLRLSCLALRKNKKLSELGNMTAPGIKSSTREERLDYVLNEWKCLHNCELCGKCHILKGRCEELLYADYIDGKRSYMDITLEIRSNR